MICDHEGTSSDEIKGLRNVEYLARARRAKKKEEEEKVCLRSFEATWRGARAQNPRIFLIPRHPHHSRPTPTPTMMIENL
jgi:3-deoxy-D-manno-octulosonic-acid transferase